MQVDVRAEPEGQPRPPGQQPRREVQRDALEVVSQEAPETDVDAGHQRQRRQEVLAELTVRDTHGRPGSTRLDNTCQIEDGVAA